jgi:DNA-binding protein
MSTNTDDKYQTISFDATSLILDIETKCGDSEQIEAFSGPENDAIIKFKVKDDYNRLFWRSFGSPELKVIDKSAKNAKRYLKFDDNGFLVKFDLFTNEQRTKLAELARYKFNIPSITNKQILFLNVDSFKCTTSIMDPSPPHKQVTFRGEALPGQSNTKTVRFNAPFHTSDRKVLDEYVKLDKNLEIQCELTINGNEPKTSSQTITTNQLNKINFEEELFGDANSVYVTRAQIDKLTSDIKSFITSVENIESSDKQFDQTFINDLLKKLTNNNTNVEEAVEVDEAIKYLSSYDYSKDQIEPDKIKKGLAEIYKIEKKDSKDYIVLNNESSNKNDELLKISGKASINFNDETLEDQLKELNKDINNAIEWKIEGESIIPKAIKVTKIIKTNLNKQLQFDDIKTKSFNKIINKKYSFSTEYIQEEKGTFLFFLKVKN